MMRKVLVANRGEIAVRVMAACRELGMASVAVYSEADALALHVLSADEAVPIGPPSPLHSYLNIPVIIEAARQSGADAVHPGYGFLSENPAFAEAVLDAGLTWIGPSPQAMRAMASKIAAKHLAAKLGIPLLPGYDGEDQSDERLAAAAEQIGFPLLIKASAGGGGRGMRVVQGSEDFPGALAAARREARAAFDDNAVLLERYLARPRHVEIQVFGDSHGTVLHFGERECSIQRRHQKVIEESPSPALTPALREAMGAAAVRLASAIGYSGAGTVEFLLDEDSRFAFLEMNTRLQVEHGVTELVTGIDLVHLQLRVAAGEPLAIHQSDVRLSGHAIQCRLYAEDPAHGFRPSTGRLRRFRAPDGRGVRNDLGVYEGAEVSEYYDPMLGKLLVWGVNRTDAIARACAALEEYRVEGVTTNLRLLTATLQHPAFDAGETTTAFLDEHILPSLIPAGPEPDLLAAAALFAAGAAESGTDPWAAGPWRPAGTPLDLTLHFEDRQCMVRLARFSGGGWRVETDGQPRVLKVSSPAPGRLVVSEGASVRAFIVGREDGGIVVRAGDRQARFEPNPPPSVSGAVSAGGPGGASGTVIAPLAGVVVRVLAGEGETVEHQQPLVILEAMKMEHTVAAPASGVIRRIHHSQGDRVQAGDLLVEIEPEKPNQGGG